MPWHIVYNMVIYFNKFIIIYIVTVSFINIIQMLISFITMPSYMEKAKFSSVKMYRESQNLIPISVLVPVHDEELSIVSRIKSLLDLNYLTYEVIVINDGSKDSTVNIVIDAFNLKKITYPVRSVLGTKEVRGIYYNPYFPRLFLIDKENGGKADALNAGINISRYPYFVSIDSDSLFDSDSLIRIAIPFMEYKYTVAVGGIVGVANGRDIKDGQVISAAMSEKSIVRFQRAEYFRAFLVSRVSWSVVNSTLIISGAFCAFQKDSVMEVGGYATDTMGEDMDLVFKLHRYMRKSKYKYKFAFLPDPICWTQVPESIKDLYGQRRRWHIGLIDSLDRSRDMFLRPKYGILGLLSMPYYFLFEILGPIIEGLGFIVIPISYFFGILSLEYFALFFITITAFSVILSLGSLAIKEYTFNKYANLREIFTLSVYSIVENFSYRQMTVFFQLAGFFRYRKSKYLWSRLKHQEFAQHDTKPSSVA